VEKPLQRRAFTHRSEQELADQFNGTTDLGPFAC